MLITHQHPKNKSLMVAVLGRPNAGKSSLINKLIGFDLAIVSPKPQTTRNHFHCNMLHEHTEVVFVDTPGVHKSGQELNMRMNGQARDGADGADMNLVLVDLTTPDLVQDFSEFAQDFKRDLKETWVVFTKKDARSVEAAELEQWLPLMKEKMPSLTQAFAISVNEADSIDKLQKALLNKAPSSPHLYPGGEVSNKNERFFATEYIREQAYHLLQDELPYEMAVVMEEYNDTEEETLGKMSCLISASILVNRPSQRAIVIGTQGKMIKEIGTRARQKIEAMVGGKVHLNLHVKVSPKWFKNNYVLEELGLPRTNDSHRVWRKK